MEQPSRTATWRGSHPDVCSTARRRLPQRLPHGAIYRTEFGTGINHDLATAASTVSYAGPSRVSFNERRATANKCTFCYTASTTASGRVCQGSPTESIQFGSVTTSWPRRRSRGTSIHGFRTPALRRDSTGFSAASRVFSPARQPAVRAPDNPKSRNEHLVDSALNIGSALLVSWARCWRSAGSAEGGYHGSRPPPVSPAVPRRLLLPGGLAGGAFVNPTAALRVNPPFRDVARAATTWPSWRCCRAGHLIADLGSLPLPELMMLFQLLSPMTWGRGTRRFARARSCRAFTLPEAPSLP